MFQFAEFLHHAALTLLILVCARLALGFGLCLHPGLPSCSKPSRGRGFCQGWAGDLLAARCQKQRGGKGVFTLRLQARQRLAYGALIQLSMHIFIYLRRKTTSLKICEINLFKPSCFDYQYFYLGNV